mgnify:CR=1 FL=1
MREGRGIFDNIRKTVHFLLSCNVSEVLVMLAQGIPNKEIADKLHIAEGTVKNHVHNALEKLHLSNRTQAAAYTVAQGLGLPQRPAPEPRPRTGE